MLNFLIALLSNSLATVLKYKHIIMTAQRLNVVMSAHYKMTALPAALTRKYYSWSVPKFFVVKKGNVCVLRTIISSKRT